MFAQKQTEHLVSLDITYRHVPKIKEMAYKGLVQPILK